jgi:hypothetical protein
VLVHGVVALGKLAGGHADGQRCRQRYIGSFIVRQREHQRERKRGREHQLRDR